MLATPPCGTSSNIALWRAKIKPPVELVVGDWAIAKELNQKVDDGATGNAVSDKINPGGDDSFGDRATYYDNIVNNNAFANLGMEEDSDE